MTAESQQIAIAELCGKLTEHVKFSLEQFKDRDGYPDAIFQLAKIPDYLHDLNACHEMEKLSFKRGSDWHNYYAVLGMVCRRESIGDKAGNSPFSATAAQRAEAFLRTMGKWEET